METPPSPVRNLYTALRERGFEVTFAVRNTTLSVGGRDLDPEQIELLAEIVSAHGGRMIVDQRGRFEILDRLRRAEFRQTLVAHRHSGDGDGRQ